MTTRVERRVFVNTAVLGIGEVIGQLANLGFIVLLARRFGPEVLGWYAFGMALGAVLAPFVSLGGVTFISRELAREPGRARALFVAMQPVQLLTSLTACVIIVLTAWLASAWQDQLLVIVIVGVYQVLLRMMGLYLAPAAARERPLGTAIASGGHRVLFAVLAASAIMAGYDAPVALLAMPFSALLALVAAKFVAYRDMPTPATETVSRKAMIQAGLPFLGIALLAVLYSRGGVLMLTALRGDLATGIYAAADRLLAPMLMIVAMLATAVTPALSRFADEPTRLQVLAQRCLRLILLLTIPLAAVLAMFATDITRLIFGAELARSAGLLAVLAPLVVLRSVSTFQIQQCIATDEEHRLARTRTIAVVAYFALGAAAIAFTGSIGLAIVTVASEAYFVWSMARILASRSQGSSLWTLARGPLLAAIGAALAAALATSLAFPARLTLVAVVLVALTFMLGGLRVDDVRFLLAILRREPSASPKPDGP